MIRTPQFLPHVEPVETGDAPAFLFGWKLPHLPDFLADHTLLGESPSDRIAEFLDRWIQFVGWLWKWRGTAFALRFAADPLAGEIDVTVLGRLSEPDGAVEPLVDRANDLWRLLATFGLTAEALQAEELSRARWPFENPAVAEVHQHEEMLTFPLLQSQQGYVVHPYRWPAGSLLAPFETLLRQSAPVIVSSYLEPTELTDVERNALERAAAKAETMKEHEVVGDYLTDKVRGVRFADPQMALAARLYADLLKRVSEPFLIVTQIASQDATSALTVARAFARAFSHEQDLAKSGPGEHLPSSADVQFAADPRSLLEAHRAFRDLVYRPWGPSLASNSPGLERLRLLNDAAGAAVAWRLPLSVRGGIPGIPVRQPAPDFEPGPRPSKVADDELMLGTLRRGGVASIKVIDLTRHVLVTGFTGSGKTNTTKLLLHQLWRTHGIPFLVIEAAKKEYRQLVRSAGLEDLLIFTLGDESSSPFRLNPFELVPGVRVEAHIARLQACFEAALPQFGILPSIVSEALDEIYASRGWKLTDRASAQDSRLFPTMRDMYTSVVRTAERRGYSGETRDNIRAAAAGRIGNLLRGSKGRMFGAQRSIPASVLLEQPVVLEMNDLNEDDKALTMMFLLMLLREYRELHAARTLKHVTIIEEAHNVVANVQSVSNPEVAADTRAKAVAAFANMLAEMRSYGEGIIITDQSPEKLAPEAMRNTNLQIAHQLRDQRDRDAVARAMIMDSEQQDYLGKLRVGEAALFVTGLEKATFITVPEFEGGSTASVSEEEIDVTSHMARFRVEHLASYVPFDGCRFCGSPCTYREDIEPWTLDKELHEEFRRALLRFDEQPEPDNWPSHWRAVFEACRSAAERAGRPDELDAAYCYLAHEIDFPFTEHMRRQFEQAADASMKG